MTSVVPVTGNPEADQLLTEEPLALMIGMLLDQQVPMEWAFGAPLRLRERLDGRLDAAEIATLDPDRLEAVFRGPPALHRFPGAMGKRTQALCQMLVDDYRGDAAQVWANVDTGAELLGRLKALPGFGGEKARIFAALLAKRFGVRPPGWEEATAPFSDDQPRSVADIDSAESLARVRAWKKMMKAQNKAKSDPPG
ncbi:MAG TPA: HhH-GPD-type base excision DNA repair protein [Acidimicrobiales bacterium]|nr:HhH-GPD-type base excision DNA repair protein [Acidimicrobiales bacterium]